MVMDDTLSIGSAKSEPPLLETTGLLKSYKGRRVVDGVSLQVRPGEIVGLLGPNGAGKTTSFNMVVGVVRPESGTVTFQRQDVTPMAMHQRLSLIHISEPTRPY